MQHVKQYPGTTWHARAYRWSQQDRIYPQLQNTTKCRYWWSIPLAPFRWLLIRAVVVVILAFTLAEELVDKLPKWEHQPRPTKRRKSKKGWEDAAAMVFVFGGFIAMYALGWISHPGYTLRLTLGLVTAAAVICLLWKLIFFQPLWRRLQQIRQYAHDKKELVCPVVEIIDAD